MDVASLSSLNNRVQTESLGRAAAVERSSTQAAKALPAATAPESTRVELSAYGQTKSATALVETAANRLRDTQKMSSAREVRESAQSLADSLNQQQKAIENLGAELARNQAPAPSQPTVAADAKVNLSSNEMRLAIQSAVGGDSTALQRIGFSTSTENVLSVDNAQLQKSFAADPQGTQATLAAVGQAVSEVANAQLAPTGPISAPISSLTAQLAAQSGTLDAAMLHQNQMRLETEAQQRSGVEQQVRQQQDQAQQAFAVNGTQVYSRVLSF